MKTKTDAVLTFGQCLFFWCSKRTAWAEIKRGPSVAQTPQGIRAGKTCQAGKTAFYSQDHIRDHLRFVYCLAALPLFRSSGVALHSLF